MATEGNIFKNRRVKFDRLIPFGFARKGRNYVYSTVIAGGQFEMNVTITSGGKESAEIVDLHSKEPYVLHQIHGVTGAFVGNVRREYDNVLSAISEACFEPDIFKSENATRIIEYLRDKYQDELEFLWKKFPYNAIVRRKDNAKWYAALLVVKKSKIGFSEDDEIEIIDLRVKPQDMSILLDGKKYFPGYHMNKKHWVTARLDGSVPVEELFQRIDESFAIAAKP